MPIEVYAGIPKEEINKKRINSDGLEYTLNHNETLVANMKYSGKGENTNNQGWDRDKQYFFKQLLERNEEIFSPGNKWRINNNLSPQIDSVFIKNFPEYAPFKGQRLFHHHIGGDGQGVAVPESIHNGSGGIHNIEKMLGIWDNGEAFSRKVEDIVKQNPDMLGKTADIYHKYLDKEIIDKSIMNQNNDYIPIDNNCIGKNKKVKIVKEPSMRLHKNRMVR